MGRSDLHRVEGALASGDLAAARDELIAGWRARRSPVLAELVDVLDSNARDATSERIAAIITPRVVTSLDRLEACADLDDPRLARFALDALENLPFTTQTAEGFLAALIDTVGRLRDARVHERADKIRTGIQLRITRAPVRDRLLRRLAATAKKIAIVPSSPRDAELAKRIEPLRKVARSADALLADIYANPFDDGPRLVYADFLLERGDPRGELIALQIARGNNEASERERVLIKEHGRAWLGPLVSVLSFGRGYSGTRFERGFVHCADIVGSVGKKLRLVLDEPSWATVEMLAGGWDLELLMRAPFRALRRFGQGFDASMLSQLAGRKERLVSVTELLFHVFPDDPAALRRAFPSLTTLNLWRDELDADHIATWSAFGVAHIHVDRAACVASELAGRRARFEDAVLRLTELAAPCERLSLVPPWNAAKRPPPLELRRGMRGTLELV